LSLLDKCDIQDTTKYVTDKRKNAFTLLNGDKYLRAKMRGRKIMQNRRMRWQGKEKWVAG